MAGKCWLLKCGVLGRRQEQSWELNVVLERGLEKEFWGAPGGGWGDRGVREVGKKRGAASWFLRARPRRLVPPALTFLCSIFIPRVAAFIESEGAPGSFSFRFQTPKVWMTVLQSQGGK